MKKYTSRNADKFVLRMPEGLRDQIKDMAQANRRSMNQQLLVMLTNQSESIPAQPEETWIPQIGQLVQLRDSFKVSDNVEMGVIVGFVRVKGYQGPMPLIRMITSVYRKFIKLQSSDGYTYGNFNGITFVTRA